MSAGARSCKRRSAQEIYSLLAAQGAARHQVKQFTTRTQPGFRIGNGDVWRSARFAWDRQLRFPTARPSHIRWTAG